MGNNNSSTSTTSINTKEKTGNSSRILFFLHRTWTVIVAERWTRSLKRHRHNHRHQESDTNSDYGSQVSQYTFCSCSQCQRDDGFSSACDSELFGSASSMAPNSEESLRFGQFPLEGTLNKEKQRPPIYNPEDYVLSLKKWGRKSLNGGGGTTTLYQQHQRSGIDLIEQQECLQTHHQQQQQQQRAPTFRDYTNPMLLSTGSEMTLRQFGTVSELLTKLKSDLRLAYPSFVQEFVGDPLDGVTLLLDLLRAIQLTQTTNSQCNNNSNTTNNNSNNGTNVNCKLPPSLQRRALLDELSCLQCLQHCCQRYNDSIQKLIQSSAGLFTLAICIMSNVTKTRVLSLELLTSICKYTTNGHSAISEAMSTLRLRFGEPVRFRFLVGMLMSCHNNHNSELLVAGMRFLNAFLDTANTKQKRLYIQAELEQAGLDVQIIKKGIQLESMPTTDQLFVELERWENNHIDIEDLMLRLNNSEKANDNLRDKVLLLERKVQILLEEKGILISLEQCLKERCSELQEEVLSLKSEKSRKNSTCSSSSKKKAESPHEDEGISSSERSYSPENLPHQSQMYQAYNLQKETLSEQKNNIENVDDNGDEEETTIDEVIEELKNIINDAETEAYRQQNNNNNNDNNSRQKQNMNKIDLRVNIAADETAIVPSNLHPQPPRRTKSLIHLFIPCNEYNNVTNKEFFFENGTTYSDSEEDDAEEEEGSDSLLSASKYQLPRVEKPASQSIKRSESHRHMIKCEKTESFCQRKSITRITQLSTTNDNLSKANNKNELMKKSKSLDRIDDGLDSMVDIVVTDTINLTKNCLNPSPKIFLPNCQNLSNNYLPRVHQEKRSNSFLIKRGHTNAGLYSGQIRDLYTATATKIATTATEKFAQNLCKINGKLSDMPSGLY